MRRRYANMQRILMTRRILHAIVRMILEHLEERYWECGWLCTVFWAARTVRTVRPQRIIQICTQYSVRVQTILSLNFYLVTS